VSKNYTRGTGRGYSGATFGGGSQTAEVIALKKLRDQKIAAARREGQDQMAQLLKLRNANPENVRRQAEIEKEAADIKAKEKVRKSFARGNQLAEAFERALAKKK
jgi:DNA-binding transcriptional ArsR family regulator